MNSTRFLPTHLAALGLAAAGYFSAACGQAAPLTEATAVLTRPDPSAPAVAILKAGSEPVASDAAAPDGWTAVTLAGPFEGYVKNADLTKSLDVKPGSFIYLAPKPDAGVLETAAQGDKITITGLRGRWTQVRLDKALVGYIHPNPLSGVGQSSEVPQTKALVEQAPAVPPSGNPSAFAEPGKPVAANSDIQSGAPHQFFEGKFASTRRLWEPQRPYAWQLLDSAGNCLVYLDVDKLLLTEQIGSYVGRTVEVFGPVAPVPGTRDVVVTVETLQLK